MNKIEQLETALKILRAEEAGKPLEWEFKSLEGWGTPIAKTCPERYIGQDMPIRIKPWTLGREINGHTLPDGASWHRNDWKKEMLPPPYRPLMLGESGEYEIMHSPTAWIDGAFPESTAEASNEHCRTTRPIPKPSILTDEQKAAGWVEWHGGENPIPGKRCEYMLRSGFSTIRPSDDLEWSVDMESADIIAYRVVEPEWVDLEPEDVPPMTVFRGAGEKGDSGWCMITSCSRTGIRYWRNGFEDDPRELTWTHLNKADSEINRSLSAGKWDPNAWEPCRKEKP